MEIKSRDGFNILISNLCFPPDIKVDIYLFIVYLTTLSVSQDYLASNEKMIVNNVMERMWKEAVVA
jgi:hypothetical protein